MLIEPLMLEIAGGLIALLVLGLAGSALAQSLSVARQRSDIHARQLEWFDNQVAAAKTQRQIEEQRTSGAWSGSRKFRIDQVVDEAENLRSFHLVPHDGKHLQPFYPGQYLTFHLRIPNPQDPRRKDEVVRCYSLSDSPDYLMRYRVTIKRLGPPPDLPEAPPGRSSNYFHRELTAGQTVDVKAPSGHFVLDPDPDKSAVFLAGGVGITPLFSMFKAFAARERHSARAWLFYGVRHGAELAFKIELENLARAENMDVRFVLSDPHPEDTPGPFFHHQGRINLDLLRETLPSNNMVFYLCGPGPMMQAMHESLREWGVPEEDIRMEAFGPASAKRQSGATVHQVSFARSKKQTQWTDQQSFVQFIEQNGIEVSFGCYAGNCGQCMTAMRDGRVAYDSPPGAEIEEHCCLPCSLRPTADLVLDA